MAVEPDFHPHQLKRTASSTRKHKKIGLGDRVEVRSLEDGFLGSWHSGEVVAIRKGARHVRYDNILCDDASSFLVEIVDVPPVIDGVHSSSLDPQSGYRGCIRPLPPSFVFSEIFLHYGLCVDAFYKDAWWEGVIFDFEDGSQQRSVFFPDMGDELTFSVDKLRITQDWDESTYRWKARGDWLLLKLVEECDHETPLTISIKQLWYDLQEKEDFKKVKNWICSEKNLWKQLVLDVAKDQFALAVNDISSPAFLFDALALEDRGLLELPNSLLSTPSESEVNLGNLSVIVAVRNDLTSGQMIDRDENEMTLWDGNGTHNLKELDEWVDGNCSKVYHSCIDLNRDNSRSSVGESIQRVLMPVRDVYECTVTPPLGSSGKGRWKLAGPDLIPVAKFCPDAVTKLLLVYGRKERPSVSLIDEVRMHLTYMEWKIEFMEDSCGHYRYTSPDAKVYLSLRKACEDIEELAETTAQLNDDQISSLPASVGHSEILLLEQPPKLRDEGTEIQPPKLRDEEAEVQPSSGVIVIEPDYCPQAISDWCAIGNNPKLRAMNKKSNLSLKAKQHLSSVGWTISYTYKSGRRQLRFISPRRKSFNSLYGACKACIDKGENISTNSAKSRPIQNIGFSKYLVQDNLVSGPSSSRKRRNPLVLNTATRKLKKRKGSGIAGRSCRGHVLRSSKRARVALPYPVQNNPRTVLSWLIDNNMVLAREKVKYIFGKDKLPSRKGKVTHEGIKCTCCGKVYSVAAFEVHAGGKSHHSSANLYLDDGRSLMDCQIEVLNNGGSRKMKTHGRPKGHQEFQDSDSICSVCRYGGDLILCDHCPSSFHKKCLGLKDTPEGDWFCPLCCCKICGHGKFHNNIDKSNNDLLSCYQCHHRYHMQCLSKTRPAKLKCSAEEIWFCNRKCLKIFKGLNELLGRENELCANNLTWTLQKFRENGRCLTGGHDVQTSAESYSKLSVALEVMHECFETVKDPLTGRDIVEDVLFSRGSNLSRLNFQGFYTVLLEKNEELISVATVRVFGKRVAEVPLVATRFQYRRLGMCRILMNELEKKLSDLGIERLILPAVPGVLNTWTTSFGFTQMTDSERLEFLDNTFLDFPGTFMCQKLLGRAKLQKGARHKFVSRNADIIDLDRQSALSEVFQAEQIDDNPGIKKIIDSSMTNYFDGGIDLPSVTLETRLAHIERGQIDHQICLDSVDKVATCKKENRKLPIGELKFCYKRRRVSALVK